ALFGFSSNLPIGSTFRMPQRFLWVDGFSLSVLTAFGADALLRPSAGQGVRARGPALALLAIGAALFFAAADRRPAPFEWVAIVGLAIAALLVAWRGRARLPSLGLTGALLLNPAVMSPVLRIRL